MNEEELKTEITSILRNPADPAKPWMTANRIRQRLRHRFPGLSKQHVFAVLNQLEQDKKRIRHSDLPSRKSLDFLWANTDNVGEREMFPIHKTNVADDFFEHIENLEDAPICFISHSFKDTDAVLPICNQLLEHGIYPWMAECEIEKDAPINTNVIEGLNASTYFMLYLSRNSLQSTWTRKEFEFAEQGVRFKPFIVFESDPDNPSTLDHLVLLLDDTLQGQEIRRNALNFAASNKTEQCRTFLRKLVKYRRENPSFLAHHPSPAVVSEIVTIQPTAAFFATLGHAPD